ncbi:unnamed protein product [Trifolium pratense]|uniref:Uncharacterized protein n=1 Tax=Trifolium pratense TaxID=57577 RepID=A0ACB0J360_TRIPR|nr:unnamed protein product [Trifolium pratense]
MTTMKAATMDSLSERDLSNSISHRHGSSSKHRSPTTTVQYRSFSLLDRGPVFLQVQNQLAITPVLTCIRYKEV